MSLQDPTETHNIAKDHPELVKQLLDQLATYQVYVGPTPNPDQYICDKGPGGHGRGVWKTAYGPYMGPCCTRKSIA